MVARNDPDPDGELPPPIVDAEWLRREADTDLHEHGPTWRRRPIMLCAVRTSMTASRPHDRAAGDHLAGAVTVSLEDDLSGAPGPVVGRHPLPAPEAFAAALEARGIGDDAFVLAVDDRGGAFAARLVWMLRIIGQPAAYADLSTEDLADLVNEWALDEPIRSRDALGAGSRRVVAWPRGAIADADEVVAHVAAGGVVVDSREAPRYRGEIEPIDAVAGHVPGAINLPFAENLGSDGRFRAPAELAARLAPAGVDGEAIVYCGSGVTACHNALAAEHAGCGRPRVYVGSWSGWSSDPDRPVATGEPA